MKNGEKGKKRYKSPRRATTLFIISLFLRGFFLGMIWTYTFFKVVPGKTFPPLRATHGQSPPVSLYGAIWRLWRMAPDQKAPGKNDTGPCAPPLLPHGLSFFPPMFCPISSIHTRAHPHPNALPVLWLYFTFLLPSAIPAPIHPPSLIMFRFSEQNPHQPQAWPDHHYDNLIKAIQTRLWFIHKFPLTICTIRKILLHHTEPQFFGL